VVRVRVDRVSKRFTLRRHRPDSIGQLLLHMLPSRRAPEPEPFWALRDVSFEVEQGRSLGVIGPNGAGKSTLLKILTRTMLPTSGTVEIHGRVSALIELGAGFHPDFTGRENILLNASILGIPRREILRKMDDIIEFSGIAPFIDTPVKYYSSGMQARLGFSVAIHVEPDILIVDEVLAVGDQAFAAQCMERIRAMQRQGVSILLVSHDLASIEALMHEAVWLDHGEVRARGAPREVVARYRGEAAAQSGAQAEPAPMSIPPVQPVELRVPATLGPGDPFVAEVVADNPSAEDRLVHVSVRILLAEGLEVARFVPTHAGGPLAVPPGRHTLALSSPPPAAWLPAGTYRVDATIFDAERHAAGVATAVAEFRVRGMDLGPVGGIPVAWTVR